MNDETLDSLVGYILSQAELYKQYFWYDSTGRIRAKCRVDLTTKANMESADPQSKFVEAGDEDINTVYIKDGEITQRPDNPAVLSGMTISGLPSGSQVQIDTSIYDVTDDHVDLSFDREGVHKVRVISWPYLDKEFDVEATSQ
jgi:hypothetical protein